MSEEQSLITDISPFLKWAGGKRWLVSKYLSFFPSTYNRYIEPFLGSGAVFFSLRPKRAILSDINKELVETYLAIRTDWNRVVKELKIHHQNHSKRYYYKMRDSKPRSIYTGAARFIYLNRTCWNGLYRVNLKGEFNVPIGTKTDVLMDSDNFAEISSLLQNASLNNADFEDIIDKAKDGDLLFVDPPYTVKHNENAFIKYNEKLFGWLDQVRLSLSLRRAKQRGVKIILTNACNDSIKELYNVHFEILTVKRCSIIAADSSRRKRCEELIIRG